MNPAPSIIPRSSVVRFRRASRGGPDLARALRRCAGTAATAVLLAAPALAQPAPREVPEGFVLPGPPPTGPAAAAGTPPGAAAPTVSYGGRHAAGGDPDWPCIQRKVPALDRAAVWTGPSLPDAADWRGDAEVAALAERLAQRRLPLPDAEAEVAAFASRLSPDARARRLPLLFAALFDRMDAERSEIMVGIDRYARRQKATAEDIRKRMAALGSSGQIGAGADPAAMSPAETDLQWETRIFNERRAALSVICEVPRTVEQRLFALGRAITAAMK